MTNPTLPNRTPQFAQNFEVPTVIGEDSKEENETQNSLTTTQSIPPSSATISTESSESSFTSVSQFSIDPSLKNLSNFTSKRPVQETTDGIPDLPNLSVLGISEGQSRQQGQISEDSSLDQRLMEARNAKSIAESLGNPLE